jgi:hypothetical protein
MASISVNPSDFQDVFMVYLLDLLTNGNEVDNEEFTEILTKMRRAGIRANLINAVYNSPGRARILYKMIRKTLSGESAQTSRIVINPGQTSETNESILENGE